ncbi:MAG: phospho-N-acetylmuramoyl-pentapeptide-transferase, partial [Lapillicoccus sp.]
MRAILIAGAIALFGTLLGTRWAISILTRKGYGQLIRDDGPTSHHTKRGTPTMGGTVIIFAVVVAYCAAKTLTGSMPSISAVLLLGLLVGMGAVGFVDDYIKIVRQRSLGLRSKAKFIGQTTIAVAFGWLTLQFSDDRGQSPASSAVSFIRLVDWRMPTLLVLLWVLLMVVGTS